MKKKLLYLVLTVAINFVGFIILAPNNLICLLNFCGINDLTFTVGKPLFFGMLPITLTFFVLLFVKNEKIGNLYKIFIYYFVASLIIVFLMPLDCNAFDPICITKTTVALFLGVVFFIFSMIRIIRKPQTPQV